MKYLSSSEFCSQGHPDRLADNAAAIVISDIQKHDGPCSHAAVEVFITHDSIIFGGEVKTSLEINDEYLRSVVKKAFDRSGYISEMRNYWTKEECVLPEDLEVVNKITAQSPDIALGTTDLGEESGYNDQGVYFSSAEKSNNLRLGTAMYLAKLICDRLHDFSRASILHHQLPVTLGPDNKCVVTVSVEEDGFTPIEIKAITIAVAHDSASSIDAVREIVRCEVESLLTSMVEIPIAKDCEWVINGTGRFVIHGPVSDTSMTGRKISVNHPSAGPLWCNKMIGGGSLVKPAHASDLVLNLAARFISSVIVDAGISSYAVVGCSGAIGQTKLQSLFIKCDETVDEVPGLIEKLIEFFKVEMPWAPIHLAEMFGIFNSAFDFGKAVDKNFFGDPNTQPWEGELVQEWSKKLVEFLD